MNESKLVAIVKLYKELCFECPNVISDIENDALTENVCRNGREVIWYMDEANCKAIYIDTLEFLTEEEIEKELAD